MRTPGAGMVDAATRAYRLYAMQVKGISRPAMVALFAVAALLFATGAAWALAWVTHRTATHTRVLPASASLQVLSSSGDVEVVAGDGPEIRLTTKERRSVFGTPHVSVRYADGRLDLDSDCSGAQVFGNECTATFVLELPRTMAVQVVAQSGDVHVDSPSPDIDVTTSSGDIHVAASNPTRVRARASSGDIHVDVPDRTYAVRANVTSGDKHVDVRQDPSSPRSLIVSATSGDVHIASDG